MQIDISPALRKQEHEIVKSLIKHAVSKHCHFTRDIKILAQNVHSGQLISDIELSILKYELEMAIENVVETDPEIQPLLQKNFPPFQDERDSPVDADRNLNVTDNADSSPQLSQQDNNLVGNAAEDVQPVHSANTINKTFESGSVTPSETAPVNRVHASGSNRQVQVTDPIGTVYSTAFPTVLPNLLFQPLCIFLIMYKSAHNTFLITKLQCRRLHIAHNQNETSPLNQRHLHHLT